MTVCKLIFLPPYSPDRNPIELAFSFIKGHLRRLRPTDVSLMDISQACEAVTPEKAEGWFKKAGYL